MINKEIICKLFEAFSIQRWTDRIRPVALVEMDKLAHKAFITYFLGKYEESSGTKIDWKFIIYGNFFALLKNIAVSDIQAPVFEKIKGNSDIIKQLNDWVISQYESILDEEIIQEFKEFLETDYSDINFRILQAAHKYSTYREFQIIKHANLHDQKINDIEGKLKNGIKDFTDIKGFNEIVFEQKLSKALSTIENLRNQTRWGQSVRIPQTSVLGHSFLVASLSLLFSREIKACDKRLYNNFYCGLFHDVPESLTRDIISPVKNSTPDLPDFISKIESEIMKKDFYPYLIPSVQTEIKYFTHNEFVNKTFKDDKERRLKKNESLDVFNKDEFSLLDGEIIKLSDEIAAFLEAMQSMNYGIRSKHLERGYNYIYEKYTRKKKNVNGINSEKIFDEINEEKLF